MSASNTSFDLLNIDPDTAKQSLIEYLRGQDIFKSYDFSGSNISQLLNILAVNTFKNAFYLNMVNAESWLDSAQLRSSVISHAKELNYCPRSYRSAKAIVDINIETDGLINILSLPKGTTFSGRVGTQSFIFSTQSTEIYTATDGVFNIKNVSIYEGAYLQDTFIMDYNNPNQTFTISNQNVDTDSITVVVLENNGAQSYEYLYSSSLLGVGETSLNYFLQCDANENYEILFGNNLFGRKPQNQATIVVNYRVSSGDAPNGAAVFSINTDLTNGHISGQAAVETVQTAQGGAYAESIEEIRFTAPRHYETQERGVNSNDYELLMRERFPELRTVAAFGGETVTPPQYGSVYVSVVIADVVGLPDSKKQEYTTFLKTRTLMNPIITVPEILYYSVDSTVNYNTNKTTLLPEDIETLTKVAIIKYNNTNFDDFNVVFRYSDFIAYIDKAHASILSNETDVYIYKKIAPSTNVKQNILIDLNVPLYTKYPVTSDKHSTNEVHAVWSTEFIYSGQTVSLEDDSKGNIRIIKQDGDNDVLVQNIGTVDYTNGRIQLAGISIDYFSGPAIKIFAKPAEKDIFISGNNILTLDPDEINISAVMEKQ